MSESNTVAVAKPATDAGRTGMPIAGWVLLLLPVLLIALKQFGPQAEWLRDTLTLETLPAKLQHSASHILFMPLAAIFVVLFRLTLGIRVLGPFRAILLAWAFQSTGVWVGAFLLVVTVAAMVTLRKPVSKLRLPYFGRISVMLSAVAVLITLFLLMSTWTGADWLQHMAHLPIVVLCLISEAFVEVLRKEGYASAVWRMFTTTILGMAITIVAMWQLPRQLMLANPELVLTQIGLIVVIARCMKWKLLEHWNPGLEGDEEASGEKVTATKPTTTAVSAAAPATPATTVDMPTSSPIAAA